MVNRDTQLRRAEVAPAPTERAVGGSFLPQIAPSSKRCRARHDVPYSLRCIRSAGHEPSIKHRDKEMNEW